MLTKDKHIVKMADIQSFEREILKFLSYGLKGSSKKSKSPRTC